MHRFITLLAHLEGAQIKQVPVKHHARNAGVSKYGLERVFKVVADMMLLLFIRKYFQRPIHLFGILGVLLIILGIFINIYLLIVKCGFGQDIGTRPLLIFGMMFILAGIQLFTIGIVMELLIRTYYESQNKRPYRIKKIYHRWPDNRKKGITLLKILFSSVLLYFVFTKIQFQRGLGYYLKGSNLVYLFIALLFFIASKVLSAFRLNLYIHQIKIFLTQLSNLKLYLLGHVL